MATLIECSEIQKPATLINLDLILYITSTSENGKHIIDFHQDLNSENNIRWIYDDQNHYKKDWELIRSMINFPKKRPFAVSGQ